MIQENKFCIYCKKKLQYDETDYHIKCLNEINKFNDNQKVINTIINSISDELGIIVNRYIPNENNDTEQEPPIYVVEDDQIVALFLFNIEKELPLSVLKCTRLKFLSLSNTKRNAIEENVFKLASIEDLDIFNNELTIIPESMARLKNLKRLTCSMNKLTRLDDVFNKLPNLLYLDSSKNRITSISDSIFFNKLKEININDNELTNFSFDHFSNNIETIKAGFNQIESLSINHNLNNLTTLELYSSKISNLNGLFEFLPGLEYVDLSDNNIRDIPDSIFSLPHLKHLILTGNPLSSSQKSKFLKKFSHLDSLDL
jgi:internalin A